jgi:hypothetical protein
MIYLSEISISVIQAFLPETLEDCEPFPLPFKSPVAEEADFAASEIAFPTTPATPPLDGTVLLLSKFSSMEAAECPSCVTILPPPIIAAPTAGAPALETSFPAP